MKLSDLIQDLHTVRSWDMTDELKAVIKKLTLIKNGSKDIVADGLMDQLVHLQTTIMDTIHTVALLNDELNQVKASANDLIQDAAHEPMIESISMYEKFKVNIKNIITINIIRNYDLFKNIKHEELFKSIIKRHASWKYPSVYVRPNSLRFFDAMKATDVYYIMEQYNVVPYIFKQLDEAEFSTVRFKLIDEDKDQFITNSLPQGQIGLIVMDSFMNYKPLGIMKQYLEESYKTLRPGGHLLFTFNDCDFPAGVRNYEQGLYCYTPGKLVQELCQLTGFKIINFETNHQVAWLCIRKPGELTTIKAGKTLGKIKKKSEPKKLDYLIKPKYNNLTEE